MPFDMIIIDEPGPLLRIMIVCQSCEQVVRRRTFDTRVHTPDQAGDLAVRDAMRDLQHRCGGDA